MGTILFGNDHYASITGYGDYVQGNLMICHVYYIEGLGHNLFSVEQFCDRDLEMIIFDILGYFFLRTKVEAPDKIINFIDQIQQNMLVQILKVRSDNGTEFKNEKLQTFYEKLGILHQNLIARTPQQNGVVERRKHTLVEAARTMLIFSKSLEFLWPKAIATA
ncbi:retrovirus-related pol polyprotein from transposon TNT 1-94 [Tanacetum coccineum]